ncbi:transmembrane protein 52B-like isoform X4 [Scyliorhinus torazame]|uniref:transmembrane protein 52B-like isoform X4 n=1 Tax=Scyliorhinus torazame TaxID=75743 RepID=UPI003B5AF5EA
MELLPRAAILIYSLSILCQLVGVRSDDDECVSSEQLLLVLSLLLVLCGILTSCLRCCGRRQQEAGVLSPRPYEVTVITLDQDNTIHSTIQNTITSIQSLFAPSARRIFTVTRCHNAAPAHENPPGYEEALERVEVPKLPEGGAGLRGMMEAAR